jgi:hypothetical protein
MESCRDNADWQKSNPRPSESSLRNEARAAVERQWTNHCRIVVCSRERAFIRFFLDRWAFRYFIWTLLLWKLSRTPRPQTSQQAPASAVQNEMLK